jgi:hypothetical protein
MRGCFSFFRCESTINRAIRYGIVNKIKISNFGAESILKVGLFVFIRGGFGDDKTLMIE